MASTDPAQSSPPVFATPNVAEAMSFPEPLLPDLAGIVLCAAASQAPPPAWLTAFLARALGRDGLGLPPGARDSHAAAALALASGPDPTARAASSAHRHAARLFGVGLGTRVLEAVLAADVAAAAGYDARTREACMRMLCAMRLPCRVLFDVERALRDRLSDGLARGAGGGEAGGDGGVGDTEEERDDEGLRRENRSRWLKIGGATVLSGVALGLSGGMLAPAILPALSSVGLTAAGSAGAGTALAAAFGTAGAGLGGAAMRNRVGAVEEFSFERCVCVNGADSGGARGEGRVTPKNRLLSVPVRPSVGGDGDEGKGMLLVYAWETWQAVPMAVPGGIRFGVLLKDGSDCSWAVEQELVDVGGRSKSGKTQRQRYTGAVTVLEKPRGGTEYIMQWTLHEGSLAASVMYRAAWIPCGHEMPPWILGKEEQEEGVPKFHRAPSSQRLSALSCSLFVPGLLEVVGDSAQPGAISDQFCGPGGVVETLDRLGVESFALVWETKVLTELSRALKQIARNLAMSMAGKQVAMAVVPALVSSFALPVAIMGAIRAVLENVWAKAMNRAHSSGIMLAAELAARGFGRRPVSLSGYSLGALIVFVACEELGRRDLQGIVHDVHIIGAPLSSSDTERWSAVRSAVSGRLVNVYNRNDWYLDALAKGTGSSYSRLAGNTPALHPGVENVSLADIGVVLHSHSDYAVRASEILLKAGVGAEDGHRTWPWAWASEDAAGLKLDLNNIDSPSAETQRTPSSLTSSSSFEIPSSPPVVVFSNPQHLNRSRRGSLSQPPPVDRESDDS